MLLPSTRRRVNCRFMDVKHTTENSRDTLCPKPLVKLDESRTFLATSASTALAMNQSAAARKIAAIITEYRPKSHADVIVGKYLEGFNQDEQPPYPRSKIVSMFTEQVPKAGHQPGAREEIQRSDIPHGGGRAHLGGDKLAVDGVLLIGEHGDYPTNDKEQKLYPRFEMFLKITDVFRQSGRSVPVFNDKHLSWNLRQAKRMVEISRELQFPDARRFLRARCLAHSRHRHAVRRQAERMRSRSRTADSISMGSMCSKPAMYGGAASGRGNGSSRRSMPRRNRTAGISSSRMAGRRSCSRSRFPQQYEEARESARSGERARPSLSIDYNDGSKPQRS